LNGFPFEGMFVDAGTPTSFVEASQACINSGRFATGQVSGDSWIGDGCENFGEVIGSSLGSNATIGEGSSIHNSVILEGAIIGSNCQLHGCLIGKGAEVNDGSNLNSKIVGHGSRVE